MAKIIESAGTHVTIDAFVEDPSVFNKKTLDILFANLIEALEMKILYGPHFVEVPIDPEKLRRSQETGKFEDEGGTSIFCVISKSHLSIHVWPLQKFFSFDAFSCADFDPQIAIDIVGSCLKVEASKVEVLHRKKPIKSHDR